MYNLFETLILGVIQGVTEFIPVSSSGHLVIAQFFFSGASDHLFLEFIDIGTTLALVVFFRKRILNIIKDVSINNNYTLARNIIITAVPAGIVGYLASGFINSSWFFGSLTVVAVALAAVGAVMVVVEKLPKASSIEGGDKLSPLRALLIGLVQIFALIPGVSRSGTTIIAGRLAGMGSAAAAEYSFLASLPIMFGVMIKLFTGNTERAYALTHMPALILSNVMAFIFGMLAVGFMMKYLSKHNLALFGWYRIFLAAVLGVIILLQ
jgi:undecaprenyl-diphosphatase